MIRDTTGAGKGFGSVVKNVQSIATFAFVFPYLLFAHLRVAGHDGVVPIIIQ